MSSHRSKGMIQKSANHIRSSSSNSISDTKSEPLWEFTSVRDVPTICGEYIYEIIAKGHKPDLQRIQNLIAESNDDLNKSDVVLLITSALCSHIGMTQASKSVTALSPSVTKLYKDLNLDNEANLKMFTTMISILCPAMIQTINMAVCKSIMDMSKSVTITHDNSRLAATSSNLIDIYGIPAVEVEHSIVGTNETIRSSVYKKPLTFVPSTIDPRDSVSRRGSRDDDSNITIKKLGKDSTLTMNDFMRLLKQAREDPEVLSVNKIIEETGSIPLAETESKFQNKSRSGLGYTDVPIEPQVSYENPTIAPYDANLTSSDESSKTIRTSTSGNTKSGKKREDHITLDQMETSVVDQIKALALSSYGLQVQNKNDDSDSDICL